MRPPGHHAGPRGIVTCPNDPEGSHGFCLLNNVAIGAAYARSMYRNDGIKKVGWRHFLLLLSLKSCILSLTHLIAMTLDKGCHYRF